MENYVRVRQPRSEEKAKENEVRITASGLASSYIDSAATLLTEKGHSTIVIRALGKAISKAVAVVEILKHRFPLHQISVISSEDLTDVWEPKQNTEGLDRIETTRHASLLTVTLSKDPLDQSSLGYQPPLSESELKATLDEHSITGEADNEGGENGGGRGGRRRGRGRGRGRGGRRGGRKD